MQEWFLLHEFHRPRGKGDYAGNLTRDDVDRLQEMVKKHGASSPKN